VLPSEERYGLAAQARRAAFSSAANIAEGSARRGRREFRRFLDIAYASLTELAYITRLVSDLEMLPQDETSEIERLREKASRLTWKLMRSMAG
jgi:four helix bundle protein